MFNRLYKQIAAAGIVLGLMTAGPALAEWSDDPTVRTPVCTADDVQDSPRLVAVEDSFIVSWRDQRRLNYSDIYAQKFSILGEMLWAENGRVIAEGPAGSLVYQTQSNSGLAHDGNGGALIAWNDYYSLVYSYFQAFITRAKPDATVAWGDPGEPIQVPDTAVPMMANPVPGANVISVEWDIAADSEGGVFVPVHHPHNIQLTSIGRFDSEGRLRTQWFDHPDEQGGTPLVLVPVVEPGGEDGVIVVWANNLGYGFSSILASKRIDPEAEWPTAPDSFDPVWSTVQLDDPALTGSANLAAVPDGAGGAIAAWVDNRTGSYRVYAQRVDTDGNLAWGPGGITITGDLGDVNVVNLAIATDGEGGAVITWNEQESDPHTLRAQRLDADGNELWAAGGVVVDTDILNISPYALELVRATDGNFVVLYHLKAFYSSDWTLVTQKLAAADGGLLWGEGRTSFQGCLPNSRPDDYTKMVSDGRAGVIVAFATCYEQDIYAHRVQALLLPELDIEKRTNGRQADGADDYDVPRIAANDTVSWTYEVTNTGDVAFPETEVLVSDSQSGVTPVLDVASDDGDLILSPDETWDYTASAPALDLTLPPGDVTIVPGCNDGRNTYENTGRVDIAGTTVFDEDNSHYCNMGDVDADGVTDSADNCMLEPNGPLIPDPGGNIQHDTDGDDFGNLCDPDFDNNLIINAADLAYMKTRFFMTDPDADLNGNGIVNAADLAIIKIMFFGPPGPSGLVP
jgi:hypothetical protein